MNIKKQILAIGLLVSAAAFPALAQDRAPAGAAGGAAAGAIGGAIVGGPIGAVVGGVGGAIVGGTAGALSDPDREYVTTYVRKNKHDSVKYDGDLAVGTVLPSGTRFYKVEGRPSVEHYSYAWINGRSVLVEPSSRRVMYVIE